MSSEYSIRSSGKLRLKEAKDGGIVKKKKSKKPKSQDKDKDGPLEGAQDPVEALERAIAEDEDEDNDKDNEPSRSSGETPAVASNSNNDRKTDAEKRFQEVQRKRLEDKVKKLAHKSHKDRVHEFNTKLEALSEHHDIPKVGPG